jgi:hypothetical protein
MSGLRKISLFIFFAVFLSIFASNGYSQGAGRQALISDVKVEAELVDTPIWKVMNIPEKPWKQRKWIQIDVDFTTAPATRRDNDSLENVTVEYELLLPTEDLKNPFVLISGKVIYWAFALDGGAHHLVAFIPPRIIEKFATGKKFNNTDAKKFDVKVEFKMNDTLIGAGFSLPKGSTVQTMNKKFSDTKTSLSLQRQKDGILGQDKTPWAYLNYDYYEQVNPDSSK